MTTIHADLAADPGSAVAHGYRLTAGAVLLAAGVALEWVLNPQQGNGSVDHPVRFALCAGTSAVGAALLAHSLRGLRPTLRRTRAVRVGRATTVVGAVLLLVAMVAILGSGLANGTPAELSFIPWALGILALTVGPVTLGLGLGRRAVPLATTCVAAGIAAFASVAVALDPWHDVALMAMCLALALAGVLVGQAVSSSRSRL